ncbi:nuclear transport factor 2 family protein [Streptomonospora sp. S1-112]|uniref:Nuclear transport factor 2 family protein n=1 Tax=Streptomonospora mangrovi TaxID=2883123 RepID=A0A9X3NJ22_9ACTN|nr:nuclear transport factor 2 family protein [Streptomonospora mangrovi]MDA0564754.1 nuclear transport factor 2 family protein [Streptomonospora mangrovi]
MSIATETADRLEITELFARLAALLDGHRPEDAASVYHEDVVVHSPRGGELRGIDEVTAFIRSSKVEGEHAQHVNGNVLVHLDGDRARATADELVYFYRDGQPPHQTSGLRTACTAVRTPKGWRFSEYEITLAWTDKK